MNPFEKHNIRHVSPSALLLWRSDPALYALRYLRGARDDAGPNAWLGNAVEAGLSSWLYKRDGALAIAAARQEWANKCQGEVSEEITAAEGRMPSMLAMAMQAVGTKETPTSYQAKFECWLDGVPVPLLCFTDWEWSEAILDLKTTRAMPSAPREDHVAQMSAYWHGRGRKKVCSLLYVTEKKHATYTLDESALSAALDELAVTAKTLMRFLDRVKDGRDALGMLPAATDGYRWNDSLRARLAEERRAA